MNFRFDPIPGTRLGFESNLGVKSMTTAIRISFVCLAALFAGTSLGLWDAGEAFAQPKTWTGPPKTGRGYKVRVDSAPQQAAVYLEDEKYGIVGYTPWVGRLGRGNWKVIVKKEGYEATERYLQVKRTGKVQEAFMPMVKVDVPASVEVRPDADQNTFGAEVWLDGQRQGTLPLTMSVDDGRHLVEVKKEGFEPFAQWIQVREGERLTVNPMLRVGSAGQTGGLLVEAASPGEVFVDGIARPGRTPLIVSGLQEGSHVVEVRSVGAEPLRQTVDVRANETTKVFLGPTALGATLLRVVSDMGTAQVSIDGQVVGTVPYDASHLAAGRHVVEVSVPGFAPKTDTVELVHGVPATVELNFGAPSGPSGVLSIRSSEIGAQVLVDGEEIGVAPLTRALSAGSHEVVVTKPGFGRFVQTVEVAEGAESEIEAALEEASLLRLTSDPPGADVFLDGELLGQTPFESAEIPSGDRSVSVRLPGFRDFEQTVTLEPGRESQLTATLQGIEGEGMVQAPEDVDAVQRGLTSFSARALPKGRSTIDLGVGYPYYLDGRITVGVGRIADRFDADAGVLLRSYFSRTELGLAGRVTLVDVEPFSLAGFGAIGGGANFVDDSGRNSFFTDLGVAASLSGLGAVTVTGRAYANFYSDRHCPEADLTTMQFSERGVDPLDACTDYLMGNLPVADRARIDDELFEGENQLFDRDNGARLMTSLLVEVAFRQEFNFWVIFEGAPFQSERAAFTSYFGAMPEEDLTTYIRAGATYKF